MLEYASFKKTNKQWLIVVLCSSRRDPRSFFRDRDRAGPQRWRKRPWRLQTGFLSSSTSKKASRCLLSSGEWRERATEQARGIHIPGIYIYIHIIIYIYIYIYIYTVYIPHEQWGLAWSYLEFSKHLIICRGFWMD